jgi:hypothetical protein
MIFLADDRDSTPFLAGSFSFRHLPHPTSAECCLSRGLSLHRLALDACWKHLQGIAVAKPSLVMLRTQFPSVGRKVTALDAAGVQRRTHSPRAFSICSSLDSIPPTNVSCSAAALGVGLDVGGLQSLNPLNPLLEIVNKIRGVLGDLLPRLRRQQLSRRLEDNPVELPRDCLPDHFRRRFIPKRSQVLDRGLLFARHPGALELIELSTHGPLRVSV